MKNGKQRRVFTGDDEGRHLGDRRHGVGECFALHRLGFYSGAWIPGSLSGTWETSLNRAITGEGGI